MSEQIEPQEHAPVVVDMELEKAWFPHEGGMVLDENVTNPDRLHSAFLGLTFPLLHLPFALWHMTVLPIIGAVVNPIGFVLMHVWYGLKGWAHGWTPPEGVDLHDPASMVAWAKKEAAKKETNQAQ